MPGIILILLVFSLLMAQPIAADLEVNFIESAPTDRFVISNSGDCDLTDLVLEIDLAPSAGRLIFDTTATGAGIEVFQPFAVSGGGIELISSPAVADGDTGLSLSIQNLAAGKSASFTIDVDDTLPVSELGQTRVANAEISGGLVTATLSEQQPVMASFGADGKATVVLPPCR